MTDTNNLHSIEFALPPGHDHPAMFSRELIEPLAATIRGRRRVLDPFAGTGRIHAIAEAAGVPRSTGVELEPEWANADLQAASAADPPSVVRAPERRGREIEPRGIEL